MMALLQLQLKYLGEVQMFHDFFENKKGMTFAEVLIALSISMMIIGAIISYFIFSLKMSSKYQINTEKSFSVSSAIFLIQQKVEKAEAIYVEENKLYFIVSFLDENGEVKKKWKAFTFESSGEEDVRGLLVPGELYLYEQRDSIVEGDRVRISNKRLITKDICILKFSIPKKIEEYGAPDNILKNFVNISVNFYEGKNLIAKDVTVCARNMVYNKNIIKQEDLPSLL